MAVTNCHVCNIEISKYKSQIRERTYCSRTCLNTYVKDITSKRHYALRQNTEKKCLACSVVKPVGQFSSNKAHADGKATYCKACDRIRCNIRDKQKRTLHVGQFLKALYKMAKSRSEKRKIPFDLTLDQLISLWDRQNGLCAITKEPMTHIRGNGKVSTNVSIDRVNSSLGYSIENLQLVCLIVNIMKNIFTIEELRMWSLKILTNTETNKVTQNENSCMAA